MLPAVKQNSSAEKRRVQFDNWNSPCTMPHKEMTNIFTTRVYIGQIGRPIQIRITEHNRHIRLAQTDKSAVA